MNRPRHAGGVLATQCEDDRGRSVDIVHYFRLFYLGRTCNVPREARALVTKDLKSNEAFRNRMVVVSLLTVFPMILYIFLNVGGALHPFFSFRFMGVFAIPVLYIAVVMPLQVWTIQRLGATFIAEAVLRYACCGSCGHLLQGCLPAPDGCIVCPECGAAWKSERLPLEPRTRPQA